MIAWLYNFPIWAIILFAIILLISVTTTGIKTVITYRKWKHIQQTDKKDINELLELLLKKYKFMKSKARESSKWRIHNPQENIGKAIVEFVGLLEMPKTKLEKIRHTKDQREFDAYLNKRINKVYRLSNSESLENIKWLNDIGILLDRRNIGLTKAIKLSDLEKIDDSINTKLINLELTGNNSNQSLERCSEMSYGLNSIYKLCLLLKRYERWLQPSPCRYLQITQYEQKVDGIFKLALNEVRRSIY